MNLTKRLDQVFDRKMNPVSNKQAARQVIREVLEYVIPEYDKVVDQETTEKMLADEETAQIYVAMLAAHNTCVQRMEIKVKELLGYDVR